MNCYVQREEEVTLNETKSLQWIEKFCLNDEKVLLSAVRLKVVLIELQKISWNFVIDQRNFLKMQK